MVAAIDLNVRRAELKAVHKDNLTTTVQENAGEEIFYAPAVRDAVGQYCAQNDIKALSPDQEWQIHGNQERALNVVYEHLDQLYGK